MFTNTSSTLFTIILITIIVVGMQIVANSVGIDLASAASAALR